MTENSLTPYEIYHRFEEQTVNGEAFMESIINEYPFHNVAPAKVSLMLCFIHVAQGRENMAHMAFDRACGELRKLRAVYVGNLEDILTTPTIVPYNEKSLLEAEKRARIAFNSIDGMCTIMDLCPEDGSDAWPHARRLMEKFAAAVQHKAGVEPDPDCEYRPPMAENVIELKAA